MASPAGHQQATSGSSNGGGTALTAKHPALPATVNGLDTRSNNNNNNNFHRVHHHTVKDNNNSDSDSLPADSGLDGGGSGTGGSCPLLLPQSYELVSTLRSLVRPLQAAEEAERLALLHRSKVKRLRAVSRHLEAEVARRKMLKCDRQSQTETVGGFAVNPYTRAFANYRSSSGAATAAAADSAHAPAPAPSPAPAPAAPMSAPASVATGVTIDLTCERNFVPAVPNRGSQQQQQQQQLQLLQPPAPPPQGIPPDRMALLPLCLKQPPRLEVAANPKNRQSAELHWTLLGLPPARYAQVANYSVWYCYQRPGHYADAWAKTSDISALPLPMRCHVDIDNRRGACHFVLRAEDIQGRPGLWSNVVTWKPGPQQMQQMPQQMSRVSSASAPVGRLLGNGMGANAVVRRNLL